jgi:hypothetical protein
MCCFSAPTKVFGTQIFARLAAPGKQMLAYRMHYEAQTPTAMILPLPTKIGANGKASEAAVRFISLKETGDLFEKLASAFPQVESFSFSRGKSASVVVPEAQVLEVHEVGDFIASFVPSIEDFSRVDPRFAIGKDIWAAIPEYKDYGFAVFQLKELKGSPHPMAFEFDTRLDATLFFPTVHIHDGAVHKTEHFEHVLYAQDASFDGAMRSYEGPNEIDRNTGMVRSKGLAATVINAPMMHGLIDPMLHLHRKFLSGDLPNTDTLVRAVPHTSSGCGRCSAGPNAGVESAGPFGTVALVGLGWVLQRRMKRERE